MFELTLDLAYLPVERRARFSRPTGRRFDLTWFDMTDVWSHQIKSNQIKSASGRP